MTSELHKTSAISDEALISIIDDVAAGSSCRMCIDARNACTSKQVISLLLCGPDHMLRSIFMCSVYLVLHLFGILKPQAPGAAKDLHLG